MYKTRSMQRGPLWLAAGVAIGLAFSPLPATTQSDVTRADLEALGKRLEALEARLGSEASAPGEGGLVVRAPFTVVNAAGDEVFTVEAEGTHVEVSAGVGEVNVSMETDGQNGAKLEVSGGIDRSLELSATPGETKLEISDTASAGITLGSLEQGETGIEISAGADTVFEVKNGAEGATLNLGGDSGQQVALEAGKEARLSLGQAETPAVELAALDKGGELTLGKGGQPVVTLSAESDEGRLELGGSEAAATLSGKGELGSLLLGKENGKRAELSTEGAGGLLELSRGGEPQVSLEAANEGGELRLSPGGDATLKLTGKAGGGEFFAGEDDGKKVQIGIGAGGDPVVQVSDGDKRVALTVSDTVGITAVSPDGAVVLGKRSDGWGLSLSKQGNKLAMLGTSPQEKMALVLFANNQPSTVLKAEGDGGTLTFGIGSQPKVELKSNDKGGQMQLGNTDAFKVQIGTMNNAIVQVTKDSDRAYLIASGDQVGIMAKSSEGFAELGKGSKGFGYTMTKDGQALANLGFFEGRPPALRVFDQGAQIAAVGAGPDGGGTLRVFPAGGGTSYAQMDAFGTGGYIGAFLPNGSPAAALDAKEHVVALYNNGAIPVATLGLGSNGTGGNVTARDGSGSGVFSAGSATDGGGEACVIRDQGKIHCLGVGLPLMGGGN